MLRKPVRTRSRCASRTVRGDGGFLEPARADVARGGGTRRRWPAHGSHASSGRPTPRRCTPSRANSPRISRWRRRPRRRAPSTGGGGTGRGQPRDADRSALSVVPGQMKFDRDRPDRCRPGNSCSSCSPTPTSCSTTSSSAPSGRWRRLGAAADQMLTTGTRSRRVTSPRRRWCSLRRARRPGADASPCSSGRRREAGAYPYVCTFPGHWRMMNGMLRVRAAGAAP